MTPSPPGKDSCGLAGMNKPNMNIQDMLLLSLMQSIQVIMLRRLVVHSKKKEKKRRFH